MTEEIMNTAIQSEIQSRDFYAKMAARVSNRRGKRRLERLSQEEEGHRQLLARRFRSRYSREFTLAADADIAPQFDFRSTDVFDRMEAMEAVSVAISAEKQSIAFYAGQLESASDDEERRLLRSLVKMENAHKDRLQQEHARLDRRFYWSS